MKIEHFWLRDPNCGEAERAAFEAAKLDPNAIGWADYSGPAEGPEDLPEPFRRGLGTVIFA